MYHLAVKPDKNCRLKLLKLERIKDYLLMEEEFIVNCGRLKSQEEEDEVYITLFILYLLYYIIRCYYKPLIS
jgi:hypothetical protein